MQQYLATGQQDTTCKRLLGACSCPGSGLYSSFSALGTEPTGFSLIGHQ